MDSVDTGSSRAERRKGEKKGKGRFAIKLCGGFVVVALAIGIAAEALIGFFGIKPKVVNFFKNFGKSDEDKQITEIVGMLPLDDDGVISITFPMVDRTNYNSMPNGFEPFYVDENNNLCKADLPIISEENNNSSVTNYGKENGNSNGFEPAGYLGIAEDYAYYLETVKDMKEKIATRDASVTTALVPIEYEVKNLYLLPADYQLYCDDPSLFNQAKVAEEHDDGSIVYSIPVMYIDKFVGVSKNVCNIIVEYDTLNGQIVDRFMYYFGNTNSYGANNESQNNMGR